MVRPPWPCPCAEAAHGTLGACEAPAALHFLGPFLSQAPKEFLPNPFCLGTGIACLLPMDNLTPTLLAPGATQTRTRQEAQIFGCSTHGGLWFEHVSHLATSSIKASSFSRCKLFTMLTRWRMIHFRSRNTARSGLEGRSQVTGATQPW